MNFDVWFSLPLGWKLVLMFGVSTVVTAIVLLVLVWREQQSQAVDAVNFDKWISREKSQLDRKQD